MHVEKKLESSLVARVVFHGVDSDVAIVVVHGLWLLVSLWEQAGVPSGADACCLTHVACCLIAGDEMCCRLFPNHDLPADEVRAFPCQSLAKG